MIENAVGTFSLPLGLGLNLQVNGRDYLVPMAVEEPSVVAAVSFAAKIVREAGGFTAEADESLMIGQVQVTRYGDPTVATEKILAHKEQILALANSFHPPMVRRGGGAQGRRGPRAAGAGGPARRAAARRPPAHRHAGGDGGQPHQHHGRGRGAAHRADHRRQGVPAHPLQPGGPPAGARHAAAFRCRCWRTSTCRARRLPRASPRRSRFAQADPYRAATHNKGVMNGIDAVAIATGQDWRAIEAGAHAFACRDGQYRPLSTWYLEEGHLVGRIELPLALGTVGGPIKIHPGVQLALKLMRTHQRARAGHGVRGGGPGAELRGAARAGLAWASRRATWRCTRAAWR